MGKVVIWLAENENKMHLRACICIVKASVTIK